MIRSLHIKNWQAHKRFEVELAPAITTIRGPSDSGKSSVLRALRWALQNHLPGEDFIRQGANCAYVSVRVEGHKIVRLRTAGGTRNEYLIDGQVYKSFGLGVPKEVSAIAAVSDLNFQEQHDPAYWLSASAPEVSRQLNSVVDLSLIDSSLSKVAAEVNRSRERVAVSEERLQTHRTHLASLVPQRDRIEAFRRLSLLKKKLEQITLQYQELREAVNSGSQASKLFQRHQEHFEDIYALWKSARSATLAATRYQTLDTLLKDACRYRSVRTPPPLEALVALYRRVACMEQRRSLLRDLVERTVAQQFQADSARTKYEQRRDRMTKELSGALCPTCGQPFPESHEK